VRTILVVCSGNICRSPMAAALLQARLARDPARADWRVHSAGLWALEGSPATDAAAQAIAEWGCNLDEHQARQVTPGTVEQADLTLAMTPRHAEALRLAFPHAQDRVHILAEMAGEHHGVEDPYGEPPSTYCAVARELARLIEAGYAQIVTAAERSPIVT
jgi:protein-tyrosine-phosphatase